MPHRRDDHRPGVDQGAVEVEEDDRVPHGADASHRRPRYRRPPRDRPGSRARRRRRSDPLRGPARAGAAPGLAPARADPAARPPLRAARRAVGAAARAAGGGPVRVPAGARARDRTELVPDPANPLRARGAFGEKSVVELPTYDAPEWVGDEVTRQGTLRGLRLESRRLRSDVGGLLWSAADTDPAEPLPLLIVHDGPEYARVRRAPALLRPPRGLRRRPGLPRRAPRPARRPQRVVLGLRSLRERARRRAPAGARGRRRRSGASPSSRAPASARSPPSMPTGSIRAPSPACSCSPGASSGAASTGTSRGSRGSPGSPASSAACTAAAATSRACRP